MNDDNVLQAILLLCSFFNKSESRQIKPLTPTEYSLLASWLHHKEYTPADFLVRKDELLGEWVDPRPTSKNPMTKERLTELLQRAASMGFALEKWHQQKVWVISRASQEYPKILRQRLGDTRSPLLYGIGNKELLKMPGIGFVGSRDTNSDDESYTQRLAQQAVGQNYAVVSGGAKGVDQTSMIAALDAGGYAIGILADSLLKAATKPQYRAALQEDRLLLITPYYPEAGFSPGNAMGRNKYIYTLSKGVVVAKSDQKGGTWTGAKENLKKQWVPLWVRDIEQVGNQKLIELGGQQVSGETVDFAELQSSFTFEGNNQTETHQPRDPNKVKEPTKAAPLTDDMFSQEPNEDPEEAKAGKEHSEQGPAIEASGSQKTSTRELPQETRPQEGASAPEGDMETGDNFEPDEKSGEEEHEELTETEPKSSDDTGETAEKLGVKATFGQFLDVFYQELKKSKGKVYIPKELASEHPELSEAIIKQWLKSLEDEGLVERKGRKLAYTLKNKKII